MDTSTAQAKPVLSTQYMILGVHTETLSPEFHAISPDIGAMAMSECRPHASLRSLSSRGSKKPRAR